MIIGFGSRNWRFRTLFVSFFFLFSLFALAVHPVEASCDGCLKDDKCYSYGTRIDGQFCSVEGQFTQQKSELSGCENSFECESNACIESKCVTVGLLRKILLRIMEFFF
ncbi:MAG: hypothetical protein ACLFTR_03785 [Candidatus Woesearchaeota archaeon]